MDTSVNMGDYSQFYTSEPIQTTAGDMGRNWLGQFLGYGSEAEAEDWRRSEQSANNAFYRSMLTLNEQNKFNAQQAQLDRDFQERMSSTAYQRAVADMKMAGLNPVLAYQQGSASSPAGSSARSGSGGSPSGSRYGGNDRSGVGTISNIAKVISGLIGASASTTAAGISAAASIKRK